MTEIFILTFKQPGAMNFEALNDEIKAISGDIDGMVADGTEIRVNVQGQPSKAIIAAVTEAIEKHDPAVLSGAQKKHIDDLTEISVLLQEFQKPVDPQRYMLDELVRRVRLIELKLGLFPYTASGAAAPAGDSDIKG